MKKFKIYSLYYVGRITYLVGLKYWYIPVAHTLYSICMSTSNDLDTENILWEPWVTEI